MYKRQGTCCVEECTSDITLSECNSINFLFVGCDLILNDSGIPNCQYGCCIEKEGALPRSYGITYEYECKPYDSITTEFYPIGYDPQRCEEISQTPQVGTIKGHIFNLTSGNIIDNSTSMQIRINRILYNVNNPYKMQNIPAGLQLVRAYATGFEPAFDTIYIQPGQETELNFTLIPSSEIIGYVHGYVYNQTTQNPLKNAIVWSSYTNSEVSTDAAGFYYGLPAYISQQQITASHYQFNPDSVSVDVVSGISTQAPDIILTPTSIQQCNHNGIIEAGEDCDQLNDLSCNSHPEICKNDCTCAQLCSEIGDCCIWDFQCNANYGELLSIDSDCSSGIIGAHDILSLIHI